ncbi:replication protein P [Burkholderia metallica]|uniref:Replication protein P n=1 Tax=Burkholderia metallica TaxID=488729 RepID=A0ABT8PES2_9BURK|nr:replication protein P [Burkholderia metallica]MDN7933637.1 replication protein P [Burkholderia metallica]
MALNSLRVGGATGASVWLREYVLKGRKLCLIDHLFNRLDGAYPNRWRASFPSGDSIENWRETWVEALDEEGVTPEMVSAALRACRRKFDWPPSLTEFLSLCKPPIDAEAGLYEAIDQMRARQHGKDAWSNPAIFWAAAKVGEYDMLSQTISQLKPRFEAALKKVLAGEVMPVPVRVAMLQAPNKSESSREYGRQRLGELNASDLVRNVARGGNIHWARRVIDEELRTGKVPLHKLNIAREAIYNVTGKQA